MKTPIQIALATAHRAERRLLTVRTATCRAHPDENDPSQGHLHWTSDAEVARRFRPTAVSSTAAIFLTPYPTPPATIPPEHSRTKPVLRRQRSKAVEHQRSTASACRAAPRIAPISVHPGFEEREPRPGQGANVYWSPAQDRRVSTPPSGGLRLRWQRAGRPSLTRRMDWQRQPGTDRPR
jgi:hypothetical protein